MCDWVLWLGPPRVVAPKTQARHSCRALATTARFACLLGEGKSQGSRRCSCSGRITTAFGEQGIFQWRRRAASVGTTQGEIDVKTRSNGRLQRPGYNWPTPMLAVSAGFEGVNLFAKAGTTVEGRAGRVPLRSLLLIDFLYFICLILGFFFSRPFLVPRFMFLRLKNGEKRERKFGGWRKEGKIKKRRRKKRRMNE